MELVLSIAVNVVLGVLLLALLYSKRTIDNARLSGPDEAMALFRRHFPDAMGTAEVAADRRSALIDLKDGAHIGLLQRHGRRWNARVLVAREVSSVRLDRRGAITLALADFGWPRAHITIADADARARWLARLNSLTAGTAPRNTDLHHA